MDSETRSCRNCNTIYVIEPDDFSFYEKMGVHVPVLCPECRFKRLALFRNETTLYTRKCDKCQKSVVSAYNPKLPYTIYCEKCYDADGWDPYSFGEPYDTSRPFFDQVNDLFKRVPKKATIISTSSKLGSNVNSEYTNYAGGNKDCYLVFNAGGDENCMYIRGVTFSRDTLDAYFGLNQERCYETINVDQSSGVSFAQNVMGSLNSMVLLNVSGLQNCFGCVNLRGKSHHSFNEPVGKDEYERRVAEIRGSYQKMQETRVRFEEFSLKFPRRENNNLKTIGSTGDYLFESKNVHHSFEVSKCEDSKHLFSVKFAKDSYDLVGFGYDSELLLSCVAAGYSTRVIGAFLVENSQEILYSAMTRSSQHCFGCDGLKNAKYCILNKQYSEGEYFALRDSIIAELKEQGEYGLYFPPHLSPFGYNECVGNDNLPLTKEQALAEGLPWQDDVQVTVGKETKQPEEIPDHINDVPDSFVNEILACISCRRNYRITPAELQFYKRQVLPIPRMCFYCRHRDRIRRRGPFKLYDRACDNCKKAITTNYAPTRPEIVYCERCYQSEVV